MNGEPVVFDLLSFGSSSALLDASLNNPMVYFPLPNEYRAVGALGITLFALILLIAIYSLWKGTQSNTTRLFYASLALMAIFELPRYCEMAREGSYNSKVTYSLHILSGSFFFVSFTIICYQWSSLLRIGSYLKPLYGRTGIIFVNIVFAVIDLTAMGLCIHAASLDSFFHSHEFMALTIIDAAKNCVYASILAYYGMKLIRKLWNYSQEERRHTSAISECCNAVTSCCNRRNEGSDRVNSHDSDSTEASQMPIAPQKHEAIFLGVVIRLTNVLLLCTVCFVLRVTMILLKIAALHTTSHITSRHFALFGVAWTVLSDFIPRVVPSLAFMHLMRSKRPAVSARSPVLVQRTRVRTHSEGSEGEGEWDVVAHAAQESGNEVLEETKQPRGLLANAPVEEC